MVVDASAIVAVIAREPELEVFIMRLSEARLRITHAVSVWEAATAIARLSKLPPIKAFDEVREFLNLVELPVASISIAQTRAAMGAFESYGRTSGHPARLNLGDCYSYGLATIHGMPLLDKGNDFLHTPLG